MDGGLFYGRGIRSEPPGVASSHCFSNHAVGTGTLFPLALHSETAANQKLDRVVETQRKEIECIRASMKAEVEQHSLQSSRDSPPPTKKLPTELSVCVYKCTKQYFM